MGEKVLFSERYGHEPVRDAFQTESMDEPLRNGLWNALDLTRLGQDLRDPHIDSVANDRNRELFFRLFWSDFFKEPVDQVLQRCTALYRQLRERYFEFEWHQVYSLLEFVIENDDELDAKQFALACNKVMQRELSAYRFVDKEITPITDEVEIAEIEEALDQTTPIAGAKAHLSRGLELLSDREDPDYRNSMKESISAVEAVAKLIAGDPKAKFGAALDKLAEKIELHSALKQGLKKIYGYMSDAPGVRHGDVEKSNVTFDDAKFMLVLCSAFVNYLIAKSQEAGIALSPDK